MLLDPKHSCHLEFGSSLAILPFKVISLLFLCYLLLESDLTCVPSYHSVVCPLTAFILQLCLSVLSLADCFRSLFQFRLPSVIPTRAKGHTY